MAMLRAQFDGKVLIPLDPVDLEAGHLYDVDVRAAQTPRIGSPTAIVQLMDSLPNLPPEDIDAVEKAIESANGATDFGV